MLYSVISPASPLSCMSHKYPSRRDSFGERLSGSDDSTANSSALHCSSLGSRKPKPEEEVDATLVGFYHATSATVGGTGRLPAQPGFNV